jgi:polysaccharide biosynthesis transport protein
VVAAALVLSGLAAGIHYSITPKAYRAATTLQIERRSLMPVSSGSEQWWMDSWWSMEFYPTQYRLLQSRGLAERVVRNLRLFEDPALGGRPPQPGKAGEMTVFDDEAALAGMAAGLLGGLEVNPVKSTQLIEIAYNSSSPEIAARVANGFADAFIDWGIETRTTTAGKASTFLGTQIETLKREIADKDQQLQAYSRSTDIVTVGGDSNITVQRLGAVNQDYINAISNRIQKQTRYNELLLSPKEVIVKGLSNSLVSDLEREQVNLEKDYAARLNTFKPNYPAMIELKDRIDRGRVYLQKVTQEAAQKVIEAARAEYQSALRQEQALAAEMERQKSETLDINTASVEFNNLKLELATKRTMLDELLRQQSETDVTSRLQGTRESNIRVVDRALVPGGPYRPSLEQDMTRGLMLGLALGLGLVFLLEYLDRTVKTPEEVERLLGLPTLGLVPDVAEPVRGYGFSRGHGEGYGYGYGQPTAAAKGGKKDRRRRWLERRPADDQVQIELLPHDRPRLAVAEAYRSLRTSLLLSSAEELKVIAVTSAEPGEGKSATASNLAVVLAQLGRRVLIVDADLRKPRLHEIFKVSNRQGLVNCLTGGLKPEQVWLPTTVPDLFVCPSGPIPPNPSELLASERMREFLRLVRASFDITVIDTPPALAVTDATLVGSMADGVVLCLRARKVLREVARACRDRLRLSEVKILGTVLNRYRDVHQTYGKRYQHYAAYGGAVSESAHDSAA